MLVPANEVSPLPEPCVHYRDFSTRFIDSALSTSSKALEHCAANRLVKPA